MKPQQKIRIHTGVYTSPNFPMGTHSHIGPETNARNFDRAMKARVSEAEGARKVTARLRAVPDED